MTSTGSSQAHAVDAVTGAAPVAGKSPGPAYGDASTKVLVLPRYGRAAASTRQRFLLFADHLAQAGFDLDIHALLNDEKVSKIGPDGGLGPTDALDAYLRRAWKLVTARNYDLIWIGYELFPYLPGWFEKLVYTAKIPVVVEYDDAIFHIYDRHSNPLVRAILGNKLQPLLRRASACICGNEYLREYTSRFCADSFVVPTVVDTDIYVPAPLAKKGPIVVGWLGSPTTWKNVAPLVSTIVQVCHAHGARFRVVGPGPQADSLSGVQNIDWSETREVADLQKFDIGIMPLLDQPFQRGKCGFKLIQYMACGKPVVASPVGVNSEIVQHGMTGFLASDEAEWASYLDKLLSDVELRKRFGAEGRARAIERYSLKSQAPRIAEILAAACEGRGADTDTLV